MTWFKSTLIRSSLQVIFSPSSGGAPRPADDGARMEDIRQRMLALAGLEEGDRAALFARRVRYATDLQALWFMRGELMALLARTHGEASARQKVEALGELFEDLLPSGLRSRPSPLGGAVRGRRPGE